MLQSIPAWWEAQSDALSVEMGDFDDEGHGFTKKENQSVAYRSIVEFLDTYL